MTDTGLRSLPTVGIATAFVRSLVHSNVFISVGTTSVAVSTTLLADFPFDPLPLFIVFAVTMFVYSFNRIADIDEDERNVPARAAFVRRYGRGLVAIGSVLYILAIGVALWQNIPYAPAMALPIIVAVLYSVVGLKRVLLVKNMLVGGAWALVPAGVGVYYGQLWTSDILFLSAYHFVMLTVAAAIFDIKDIEGDREAGIRTLPVRYGPQFTRRAGATATALVGVVVTLLVVADLFPPVYGVLVAFNVYVFTYSVFATTDHGVLVYGFIIDGEHLFLATLLAVVEGLLPVG